MQLNVYVPTGKEQLLRALDEEAERSGRSKNELVLEAIEQRLAPSKVPAYLTYPLGAGNVDRAELYVNRLTK